MTSSEFPFLVLSFTALHQYTCIKPQSFILAHVRQASPHCINMVGETACMAEHLGLLNESENFAYYCR